MRQIQSQFCQKLFDSIVRFFEIQFKASEVFHQHIFSASNREIPALPLKEIGISAYDVRGWAIF